MKAAARLSLIAAILTVASLPLARGQSYSYTIVAQTGQNGITSFGGAPSLNNNGNCAFPVQLSSGPGIFVGNGSGAPINITPGLAVSSRTIGSLLQINDNNVVVAQDQYSGTSPESYYIRTWPDNTSGNSAIIAKNASGGFVQVPSVNNGGQVAFLGFNGSSTYTLYTTNTTGPHFYYTTTLGNSLFRPMIADNGSIVGRVGANATSPGSITVYDSTLSAPVALATVPSPFSALDALPGISPDGTVVAFNGSTAQGQGIYVCVADQAGSFSSSIPYEIAGPSNGFTSFQSFSRVAVSAGPGSTAQYPYRPTKVAYIGTQNGVLGLYMSGLVAQGPTNAPFVAPPSLVVTQGQVIPDLAGTVENISIQNPLNTNGAVACLVTTSSGAAILACQCQAPSPIANIYSPDVQADIGTGEDTWLQAVDGWYYFGTQPENILLGPFPFPTNSLPGVNAPAGDVGAAASQAFNWSQDPTSGATIDLARPDGYSGGTVDLATLGTMFVHPLLTLSGARSLDFKIYYNSTISGGDQYIPFPSGGGCPYWTLYTPGDVGHWTHNFEGQAAYFPGSGGTSNMVLILLAHRRWTFIQNGGSYQTFDQDSAYDSLAANADGSFTLTTMDQSTYSFTGTNLYLTQVTNPHGQALGIDRTPNGQINTITEPVSGKSLSFTYGTAGNNFPAPISTITDSAGRTVSLSYDGNDMLTQIVETDPDGSGVTNSFAYDSARHLLSEADALGTLLVTNAYDTNGLVISQTDARGGQYQYAYAPNTDVNGNIISTITLVTDRDGNQSLYECDPNHNLLSYVSPYSEQTTYTYDSNGDLLSKTDPFTNTTYYAYDTNGNVTEVTNALGNVTIMTYDDRHNLLSLTDADGNTNGFSYDTNNNVLTATDGLGHQTVRTYDNNSLLLTEEEPNRGITSFAYTDGLLTQLTDAAENNSRMTYDEVGNLATLTDPTGATTTDYYGPGRVLVERDDAAGNKLLNAYDWRVRKSTVTDPAGGVTSYGYDDNNNLIGVTNALGGFSTFAYDPEDRLISATDPMGNTSLRGYDKDGRLVAATNGAGNTISYSYDSANNLRAVVDGEGNMVVSNAYDVCYQLLASSDALGNTRHNGFDRAGLVMMTQDPLGRVKSFVDDALGRTTTVDAPLSTATSQSFDPDGNRNSLTDAKTNSTLFSFDSADRITNSMTALGKSSSCLYNTRNLPASVTLPNGTTVTYTYDSLGRLTNAVDPVGSIGYSYDPDGRLLTTAETIAGVTKTGSRQYDPLGRLTNFTDTAGNTLKYDYYADGSLKALTYPDGKQVTYGYDHANRLQSVADWAGRTTTYNYDEDGRVYSITRPDGSTETFSYYSNGPVMQSTDQAGANVIHSISYGYDLDNQINCEDATPEPGIYRPANLSLTVDADNRLTSINGQSAVYDNDGNLVGATIPGSPISVLIYDARNRLVSAAGLTNAYDAENRRISVASSAGTNSYVINPNAGLSQVLVKTAPNGTVTRYVYGLGLIGEETGSTFTTYHYDHRGSTTALTDINGNITQTFSYGPNGEPVGFNPAISPTPFLYGGRYGVQTDANGLCYMRARYYSPSISRFINQDTMLGDIASGTSLNRFAYANGEPIDRREPSGREDSQLEPGSFLEREHEIVDHAEWLEKSWKYSAKGLESLEPAYEIVKVRLQPPGLFQPFVMGMRIEDPITNPLIAKALRALPAIQAAEKWIKPIGPILKLASAQISAQQALTEFGEGKSAVGSLHAAQSLLNSGLFVADAAEVFGAAAVAWPYEAAGFFGNLGLEAGIAAVNGTEQPIDAFDRWVQERTGFNPSLGDLHAYWEAISRIPMAPKATMDWTTRLDSLGARGGF